MKKAVFALSILALPLVGCSKDDSKKSALDQGTLAGKTYYVVDAGNLQYDDASLKGSGSVVFSSPLDSITSKDNYSLNFSLEDGGVLELVSHSNGSLNNGISVVLTRTGNSVSAALKAKGEESKGTELSGVNASEPLTLTIDIHNGETPAHILIWSASSTSFSADNALLNSEGGAEAPGNGAGTAWGLQLTKAAVTSAVVGEPKFSE